MNNSRNCYVDFPWKKDLSRRSCSNFMVIINNNKCRNVLTTCRRRVLVNVCFFIGYLLREFILCPRNFMIRCVIKYLLVFKYENKKWDMGILDLSVPSTKGCPKYLSRFVNQVRRVQNRQQLAVQQSFNTYAASDHQSRQHYLFYRSHRNQFCRK